MEQLEQLLTCCVCLDRYRNPKLLPCQHSFCMEPCMEGLVDYVRRQVKCPECRAEHRIPYQGVQAFPTNVTLQRFLELHIDLSGEIPDPTANQIMERCQVCSEKAYLNSCAHCEKKVCPDCKEAHLDVIKREITRMSSQVRRVLTRLEDALSVTDRNLAGMKGNQAHVLDEVDDLVRRFTKAINDKGNALRSELESYVSNELATLNTYRTNLETEINNIQSNCELVDKHMISEGSTITWDDQELMDTKDIFLKTIEFIRNFEYEPGDRRIRFSTTQDPNTVIVGLSNFGDLIFPHSFIVTTARQPPQFQSQPPPSSSGIMRSKSDHRLVQQYRDMEDMEDRPAGRERTKFRSRFARRLMGQDEDDRVRFDDSDDRAQQTSSAQPARTRVIDTDDAVKGPMSAIPRLLDSNRVLEKMVDYESPKKKPAPAGPTVPLAIQQQMQIMQQQQLLQQQHQQQQQQQQQQPQAANAAAPTPAPRRQVSQEKSQSTPRPTPAPAAHRTQSVEKPRTESESSSSEQSSSSASSRNKNAATAASSASKKSATPQSSASQPAAAKASTPANSVNFRRNPTPQQSRSKDESETSSEESEEETESDEPAATAPAAARTTASRDRDPPQPSRSRQRDTRSAVTEEPSRSRDPPAVERRMSRDDGSSGYNYRTRQQQSPPERPYGSGSSSASRYGTSTSSPYDSGLSRSRTGTALYEPEIPTSRLQAKYLNRSRHNMGGSVDIPDDYRSPTGKPYYSGRNAYLTKQNDTGDQWGGSRDSKGREKSKILPRSKSSHELAQAELEKAATAAVEEEQPSLSSWARYLKSKYGKTAASAGSNNNNSNGVNNSNNQEESNKNSNNANSNINNNENENQSNLNRGRSTSPQKLNLTASQYSGKKRLAFKFGARGSDPGYFTWPRGIASGPDSSIVVADSSNHRIQVFDAQGNFVKDFGTYGNGDGEFDCLAGVAVNRIGQFIVSDRYNHRIQVFDPSGRFLRSFGSQGSTDGKFNYPWGVTTDALGFIYVCDKENHRIQVFQSDGTFVGKFGVGELEHPHYIAVTCTNKVVVSDTGHHRIYICDVNGKFIGSIGTEGIEHGQFKLPRGVAVDEQGYIFVGDSGNNRIQIFNPDGVHIKSFGGWGSGDGEFKGLEGIGVNSSGNILVCDRENHRIQVF